MGAVTDLLVFHEARNFTYLFIRFQINSWLLRCDWLRQNAFTAWQPTSFFCVSNGDFTPVTSRDTKDTERETTKQQLPYCVFNLANFLLHSFLQFTVHCVKDNKSCSVFVSCLLISRWICDHYCKNNDQKLEVYVKKKNSGWGLSSRILWPEGS